MTKLFAFVSVTVLMSVTSSAAPMSFKAAAKAYASAPAVTATSAVGSWTLIALTTPDTRIATDPNGDYKADDGVVVHDTQTIDRSLKSTYSSLESATGRVRSSYELQGVIAAGSLVMDVPNSGCHQVNSCRVLATSRHLLCKTEFLDLSEECNDVGGKGPQMFIELQP